jgi:PPOX class probable F420-dependent enzyme
MMHVGAALRGRPFLVQDVIGCDRGAATESRPYMIITNMPLDIDDGTREFISSHRVARLATAGENLQPAVIPFCYVLDGEYIYSPIDEKPKSVAASSLKRVRNIEANPQVALVIDDYSEDWSKLAYVLIIGTAEIMLAEELAGEHSRAVELLREKYAQYRSMKIDERPMIKITLTRIKRWGARSEETGK